MRFHFGSISVFSDLGKAREEVSSYLNTPVRNLKDKEAHKVFQKINQLNIGGEIFFGCELACACADHKGLVLALKHEYLAHFKAQGLADYTSRREGFHVEARHSLSKPPTECIVCRGDMNAAIGGVEMNESSTSMHCAGMLLTLLLYVNL